jgi:WXG100 family type VII secretion target
MSDFYVVDLDELAACAERLSRFEGFIETKLDELDRRIQQLQSAWTGTAADAQLAAHRDWMAGAAEMKDGLAKLRQAATTAHTNYSAARAANLTMWD